MTAAPMSTAALAIFVLLAVGTIAGLIVYILKRPGEMPLPMGTGDQRQSHQLAMAGRALARGPTTNKRKVRASRISFLPHSNGEVPSSYEGDYRGVISAACHELRLRLLTPPSRYDRDTSPSEWGGG